MLKAFFWFLGIAKIKKFCRYPNAQNSILQFNIFTHTILYLHLGVASAGVLDPLYKLQKRTIRIIIKSPYKAHTTSLFKKLNMLKIIDMCKLETAENVLLEYKPRSTFNSQHKKYS